MPHWIRFATPPSTRSMLHGAARSDIVTTGAERLVDVIGRGADGLEGRIDQAVHHVPAVSIDVERRGRRKWPLVLLLLALVAGGVVFARRRRANDERDSGGGSPSKPIRFEVVPAEDQGWAVVGRESHDAVSRHATQAQGIERVTQLAAEAGGGEVVVHGLDGNPRETRSVAAAG